MEESNSCCPVVVSWFKSVVRVVMFVFSCLMFGMSNGHSLDVLGGLELHRWFMPILLNVSFKHLAGNLIT